MDPLSICASAANVTQLCGSVVKRLYQFYDAATNVDITVEGFRIETRNLQTTLINVESTRNTSLSRRMQSIETDHWSHVSTLLKRCTKTLEKLDSILVRCSSRQGVGRKPITQIRLDMKSTSISILRGRIKSYTQALQVSLQTINIVTQWQNHASIQDAIGELTERIEEVKATLSAKNAIPSVDDVDEGLSEADIQEEAEAVLDVEKIIISAEGVGKVASTSSYTPDDDSIIARKELTSRWLSTSYVPRQVPNFLDENRSVGTMDSDVPPEVVVRVPDDSAIGSDTTTDYDPDPDADDHFSARVNMQLIAKLQEAAKQEFDTGQYQKAEKSQLKLIKHLEEGQSKHGLVFPTAQVQEELARIYHKLKKLDEAKAVYNRLIGDMREKEKTSDVWRWYYCLARIYQEQGKLDFAEKFAMRSYRGREDSLREGDPLIAESVALLTQIFQQTGNHTLAKGLWELHVGESLSQRRISEDRVLNLEPHDSGETPWPADPCYDITSPEFSPQKAIKYAIDQDNDMAVETILQRTKSDKRHELAIQALQLAIQADRTRIACLLMELNIGIKKDSRFAEGKTPLIYAIEAKNDEMVREFLRRGVNLEVRCAKGTTPLMYAVERGHEITTAILLHSGAFVDAVTHGWTALHRAADLRNTTMVELLLESEADIEACGPRLWSSNSPDSKWTALLMAAYAGNIPVARLLLEKQANIEAKTSSGATPLMYAAEEKQLRMMRLLLDAGADINAGDNERNTALHRTVRKHGNTEVISLLLHKGADPKARNKQGESVLHVAAKTNGPSLIALLLANGADIESRDVSEATPLHIAIERRHFENVRVLLDHGADIKAKDRYGHHAVDLAHKTSPEIDSLLKRAKKHRSISSNGDLSSRRDSALSSVLGDLERGDSRQGRSPSISTTTSKYSPFTWRRNSSQSKDVS